MENNATITTGFAEGQHIVNGVLTTPLANEAAPGLIRSDVDTRVAKLKPMSTPVDSISRLIGARKAKSMIVEYYSVDSKQPSTTLKSAASVSDEQHSSGKAIYILNTRNNALFAESDTILVPADTKAKSDTPEHEPIMLYVLEANPGSPIKAVAINSNDSGEIRQLNAGTTLVRMGRAAGELDVQTPQFEALPRKSSNYCQIFKAQVEQSNIVRQSSKDVGWSFQDQEEVAIADMRMCMEKSFVFGCKGRLPLAERGDEVMFTEGIWNQAGDEYKYTPGDINKIDLSELMKQAFTGKAAGSAKKILIGGSTLIATLSKLDAQRVLFANDKVTHWGIDFKEIHSKFGTLLVVFSEVFDQCGHPEQGMVLDPAFMTKYVYQPLRAERLDLKKSGTRNTQAVVITEASCLVLRTPGAHLRIIEYTAEDANTTS